MKKQLPSCILLFCILNVSEVAAQTWEVISEPAEVGRLFSDTVLTAEIRKGVTTTAHYNSDGTGELIAWGDRFPREWKSGDDGQVCILISGQFRCFVIERNLDEPDKYRGTTTDTGETVVFSVAAREIRRSSTTAAPGSGGAGEPSAEELAAKLSNPTSPVMTIGNNLDVVTFKGDLPGAGDQDAIRYVFQTVFPFKLSNGGSVFIRPALPVLFNEPVPDGLGDFDSLGTDIGDIGFDFSYGTTTKSGLLLGGGLVGTIPTASDERLGKDLWGLGPELLFGKIGKKGVIGGVLAHQWDIAGSGDGEINLTSLNYFYAYSLGGGWQLASGPSITYDHTRASGDRLTLPLGVGIARTMVLGGRPWKFQLQYWNYLEAADSFAPEHQFRLSISPVVSAPWNAGK